MSGPLFTAVNHLAVRAHDPDRLACFYAQAAALQHWPLAQPLPGAEDALALAAPNAGLLLMPTPARPQRRPVSEAGFAHLCLQAVDAVALYDAHAAAGAQFHAPLTDLGTGFLYGYARDIEFNVVELEGVPPVVEMAQPWLAHVNLACADLSRQVDFYAALLGTPAQRSPRFGGDPRLDRIAGIEGAVFRMAWVHAGNLQLEFIHYSAPADAASGLPSTRRAAGTTGIAHIAFEVTNLARAIERLQSLGGALISRDAESAVCEDPEGNTLRLLAPALLERCGAQVARLSCPDITPRLAAARAALQGAS